MLQSVIQGLVSLSGRLMLVTIFLLSAVGNKIPNYSKVVGIMKTVEVPYPEISLGLAITFLIVGSISVILGYMARWGAFLLFVFMILATYYFHAFWKIPASNPLFEQQMIQFMKNLSIAGGMLFLMANGPGAWSLGGKPAGKK